MTNKTTPLNNPDGFTGATVQLFEYGNGRYEHSIIFTATHFDQLVYLLEDPLRHIRSIEGVFPYHQDIAKTDRMPWGMRPPITAIITHGSQSLPTIVKAGQLGLFSKDVIELINVVTNNESPKLTDAKRQELLDIVDSTFEHGAFYAEFAVGTRTLYITYFHRLNKDMKVRYEKSLTEISLAFPVAQSATGIKSMLGTIHFDLHDGGVPIMPIDRANYIVSYIENPSWLEKKLNDRLSFKRTNSIVSVKGPIKIQHPPKNPTTGQKPFVAYHTGKPTEYPNITVEGLSDCPGPIEPCTMLPVQEQPGSGSPTYLFHDMVIKTY